MNGKQLRMGLVSIVAMLAIATAAQAALVFSVTGVPVTPGGTYVPPPAPGSMCWTLTVSETNGMWWPVGISIDIGDGVTPLNQVNPSGMPTVFADYNVFITGLGGFVDWDTQFPYQSIVGPTMEVASSITSAESTTFLNGDFAFLGGTANPLAGPSMVVAQIVLGPGAWVPAWGTVVEYNPATNTWAATKNVYFGPIPEPATLSLLAMGGLALLRRSSTRTRQRASFMFDTFRIRRQRRAWR